MSPMPRKLSQQEVYDLVRNTSQRSTQNFQEECEFVHPVTGEAQTVSQVDFAILENKNRLGRGSFGSVYKSTHRDSRVDVAIKVVHQIDMESKKPTKEFQREMKFLRDSTNWKCPNIVQFFGFIRSDKSPWLILELMDIDLSKIIKSREFYDNNCIRFDPTMFPKNVLETLGYLIIRDITNGLRYLHGLIPNQDETPYMHRDIKPTNIMIDRKKRRLAIIDFGSTKKISKEELKADSRTPGKDIYQAPECFEFEGKYGELCDLWSLGITLIYFYTGTHPVYNKPEASTSDDSSARDQAVKEEHLVTGRITGKNIFTGNKVDWDIALTCEELCQNFKNQVNQCVDRKAENRPSADDLYNKSLSGLEDIGENFESRIFDTFLGKVL